MLDIEPRHVAEARVAAAGRADVRAGDAFAPAPAIRAALGLPPTATIDLLLAAHVGYYAPDLGRWETTLQRLIGTTGVALILQEAAFAPFSARLNPVSGVRRTARLRQVLTARRRPHAVVGFRAGVFLPPLTDRLMDSLAAAPSLEAGGDPHAAFEDGLAARHLVEFLIQRPLETVTRGDRRRYLEELRGLAEENAGLVPIDNALIVLLPARGGDRMRAAAAALEARLTSGRGVGPVGGE
ncbi:MAG: hypothetical protein GVY28_03550 [Alphaproteobacteria bacterium]|jgi:hypothetical protein|nr:hypothetical protein [Alphaproteobacteria bacterium]